MYDNQAKKWLTYDADAPSWLSSLNSVDHFGGIWVDFRTDGDTVLSCNGGSLVTTEIPLYAGWNLVGYPASSLETFDTILAGTGYDAVQEYDFSSMYLLSDANPFLDMEPGNGYWVHVPADTSYTVTY